MAGVNPGQKADGHDEVWLAHLYRGFVQTATMWRQRMDVTQSWTAPLLVGLITFALGDTRLPHLLLLLLGIVLIAAATLIEARRYRELLHSLRRAYFVEVGWFAQLLSNVEVEPRWRSVLASDLYQPRPPIRMVTAVLVRMRRTYLILLYLLIVAWICKVAIHPRVTTSIGEILERMSLGPLPGGWLAGGVGALVSVVTLLTLASPSHAELENWASEPALRGFDRVFGQSGTREDGRDVRSGEPP